MVLEDLTFFLPIHSYRLLNLACSAYVADKVKWSCSTLQRWTLEGNYISDDLSLIRSQEKTASHGKEAKPTNLSTFPSTVSHKWMRRHTHRRDKKVLPISTVNDVLCKMCFHGNACIMSSIQHLILFSLDAPFGLRLHRCVDENVLSEITF